MKKIYNNRTKRVMVFGKAMLLPGTNVAEEIAEKEYPLVKKLIDEGDLVIVEDTASAVKNANTQSMVDEIVDLSKGDKKTKEAGEKRKQQLDKIDAEAKELEKKQKEEKD
ncbi:hypothetical protein SAMN05720470_10840 [Fibrobacter sp. UWOV1]|uniref:hypothetical protein n=1 Tax=Fibrobacter sp. UWOV1 TaxID=1896215 RepID=UPI00091DC8EA|nr:hypothetical protein [Fibrobacter sp. UWOV1]SHL42203.1 hypothetical protein SAMN05720470_10840 [Fibrobacter sp. UWOV1]